MRMYKIFCYVNDRNLPLDHAACRRIITHEPETERKLLAMMYINVFCHYEMRSSLVASDFSFAIT
jgi:hypothetical protein